MKTVIQTHYSSIAVFVVSRYPIIIAIVQNLTNTSFGKWQRRAFTITGSLHPPTSGNCFVSSSIPAWMSLSLSHQFLFSVIIRSDWYRSRWEIQSDSSSTVSHGCHLQLKFDPLRLVTHQRPRVDFCKHKIKEITKALLADVSWRDDKTGEGAQSSLLVECADII